MLNIKRLENIGYKLFKSIKKSKQSSKELIQNYPENQQALNLYGSFLLDVYNKSSKGNEMLSRAEYEKQQAELKNLIVKERFSYFDENNGILIISGGGEDLGTIISINQNANEILSIPLRYAIGMNIAKFIPPPMNDPKRHNMALSGFLERSISVDVNVPFNIPFLDYGGFLLETYFYTRIVALDSHPFFLAAIKKNCQIRECILFDENGLIIANTRGFPVIIGYCNQVCQLNQLMGYQVVNDFTELRNKYKLDEVFEYNFKHAYKAHMKFANFKIKNTILRFLFATNDEEEIKL